MGSIRELRTGTGVSNVNVKAVPTRNAEADDQERTRGKEEAMKRSVKPTRKRSAKPAPTITSRELVLVWKT